jgi:ubiquinone/menaquinone biosynthesis C-methylase UbiE
MNPILRLVRRVHSRLVHSRRSRVLASHFAELIGRGHTVLDVGCGDGLIDGMILERRPDLQICGVDPLVRPDAHIAVAAFDGRSIPYPERSWDTVLFCDVLHHTEQPLELLREACRVAKCSVVIKDHYAQGTLARTTLRLMDVAGNLPYGVVLTYNYLTPDQWQEAWRAAGLVPRFVRQELGIYPWWADILFGRSMHFVAVCDIHTDIQS